MKYLLDSNIIIYYLNGDNNIRSFIEQNSSVSAISIITYYEVLNYDFSADEESIVRDFLDGFEILSISKNIINKALTNRKVKKIKMADNFILATAQIFDLDIVTRNTKDFTSFTNKVLNPFEA
jgi:predicted nucleic acid-binding protein